MGSVIVTKTVKTAIGEIDFFAVATSESNLFSTVKSLTFEAYLTPWNAHRSESEKLQIHIEGLHA